MKPKILWLTLGWILFIGFAQQVGCQLYPVAPLKDAGVSDAGLFDGGLGDAGIFDSGVRFDAGSDAGLLDGGSVQDAGETEVDLDHDNGHGNDEGCVDGSNPGKSRGCR